MNKAKTRAIGIKRIKKGTENSTFFKTINSETKRTNNTVFTFLLCTNPAYFPVKEYLKTGCKRSSDV
jgi:hypothetical protein